MYKNAIWLVFVYLFLSQLYTFTCFYLSVSLSYTLIFLPLLSLSHTQSLYHSFSIFSSLSFSHIIILFSRFYILLKMLFYEKQNICVNCRKIKQILYYYAISLQTFLIVSSVSVYLQWLKPLNYKIVTNILLLFAKEIVVYCSGSFSIHAVELEIDFLTDSKFLFKSIYIQIYTMIFKILTPHNNN